MFNKKNIPSIVSLIKICDGFGITLSQFFDLGSLNSILTEEEKEHLASWNCLNKREKELVEAYMQGILDRRTIK